MRCIPRGPRTEGRRLPALIAALVVVLAACGGGGEDAADGPSIVATTTILGDVASNVVGDDASVEVLMPVGVDPHDFQASAAQVATINNADLVIVNGLGLEEGLEDILDAAKDDGVQILEIAPLLDPLPFGGHDEHGGDNGDDEEDDSDDHGSLDPHVWFDPQRMATAADAIADALAEIDASTDWAERSDAYVNELLAADQAIIDTLASVPTENRRLITSHDSLGYFADRYGFEVIATVIPGGTTLGDPSSEELASLIELMEREGVAAIFAETTQPSQLADAVAAELGKSVEVVTLYTGSLGEPGSGADSYLRMLMTNADRIAAALGA